MDPQIPLFNNFFIKNWSHGTLYTFKNYFATVTYNTYVNKMIWIFLYYNILSLIYIFIIIGKYYEYFNPLSYPIPNQRPIYNLKKKKKKKKTTTTTTTTTTLLAIRVCLIKDF